MWHISQHKNEQPNMSSHEMIININYVIYGDRVQCKARITNDSTQYVSDNFQLGLFGSQLVIWKREITCLSSHHILSHMPSRPADTSHLIYNTKKLTKLLNTPKTVIYSAISIQRDLRSEKRRNENARTNRAAVRQPMRPNSVQNPWEICVIDERFIGSWQPGGVQH